MDFRVEAMQDVRTLQGTDPRSLQHFLKSWRIGEVRSTGSKHLYRASNSPMLDTANFEGCLHRLRYVGLPWSWPFEFRIVGEPPSLGLIRCEVDPRVLGMILDS